MILLASCMGIKGEKIWIHNDYYCLFSNIKNKNEELPSLTSLWQKSTV